MQGLCWTAWVSQMLLTLKQQQGLNSYHCA